MACYFIREGMHAGIDYAVPANSIIAVVSGGLALYVNAYCMTYFPGMFAQSSANQFSNLFPTGYEWVGTKLGFAIAPIYTPTVTYDLANRITISVFLVTSFMLNQIANRCFQVELKAESKKVKQLEQALGLRQAVVPPIAPVFMPAASANASIVEPLKEIVKEAATTVTKGAATTTSTAPIITEPPVIKEITKSIPNETSKQSEASFVSKDSPKMKPITEKAQSKPVVVSSLAKETPAQESVKPATVTLKPKPLEKKEKKTTWRDISWWKRLCW